MAAEVLLYIYGVPNMEDLGARLVGTEVNKCNLRLGLSLRGLAVPICWV